jgi:hypothetical protein
MDDCKGGAFQNVLQSSTSLTSYGITSIAPGTTCNFRMNVQNIMGYGPFSPTLNVFFAQVPIAPAAPNFVSRSGGDTSIGLTPFIEISWLPPFQFGGSPILGY